jgi:O-antigen ligase
MSRDRLDTWLERAIVGLVTAILVYGPMAFGAVNSLSLAGLQALTLVALVLWMLRLWIKPSLHLLWPPVCWWVLVFTAYAVARYLTADVEYLARLELGRVVIYAVLFLICVNNLYRQGAIRLVIYALTVLAVGEAALAIYQFVTHAPTLWGVKRPEVYLERGSGTFVCPNHLAGFLEMVLPLALAYTVAGRGKVLTRVFLGYAVLIMTAGIALSLSRGGWIAAGVGLVLLLMLLARTARQWLGLAAAVALLVGLGLALYSRSTTMQFRVESFRVLMGGFKTDVRYGLFTAAVKMWQEHPWFGVGPAHYDARFRAYRPEAWQYQVRPERVHNDYLNTLADWGMVGGLLVAGAVGSVALSLGLHWRRLRRIRKDQADGEGEVLPFVAGATASLGALLVHSAWDFNMQIPANAILALTLLALLATHGRFATDRHWVSAGLRMRLALSLLLGTALVWMAVTGWRYAHEQSWLREAHRQQVLTREHLQALERAYAIEPMNGATAGQIGEQYRWLSLRGEDGYREQATLALKWFQRAARLNPFDPVSRTGAGACLDWLDRPAEAAPWFEQAIKLDPHGYRTRAMMGWHHFSTGDYTAAKEWFEQSLKLHNHPDNLAHQYLPLTLERLAKPQ